MSSSPPDVDQLLIELPVQGPRKSWSPSRRSQVQLQYCAVLHKYPFLEGYWLKYADLHWRLGSRDKAIEVFESAIDQIKGSVRLWNEFIRFVSETCADQPAKYAQVTARAVEAVGHHFFAHEVWDAVLSIPETQHNPQATVEILCHILDNLTLHQFARFYARLIKLLAVKTTPITAFKSLIPADEDRGDCDSVREAIASKLRAKLELQQRRVTQVYNDFEVHIRRQAYIPNDPLPESEVSHWISYLTAHPSAQLFRRSLIPAADTDQLWIGYIRYLIRTNQPPHDITKALVSAPPHLKAVQLYRALWLELTDDLETPYQIYEQWPLDPQATCQYSQFLVRQGKEGVAIDKLKAALESTGSVPLVAELAKYDPQAFERFAINTPEYFRAYLKWLSRRPAEAAKYLQIDRIVSQFK